MSGHDLLSVLRPVLRHFDEVSVPAGVVLAQEGRLCHEFFVVVGGELEACRQGRTSRLSPGDAVGWQAMHDRGRHDATVITMSPSRLLVMSHAQFRAAEGLGATCAGAAAPRGDSGGRDGSWR